MLKNQMLAITSIVLMNAAYATPTIWPTEDNQVHLHRVVNQTNSNLVADNVQPMKVYVMPPNSAKAVMQKKLFLRTANLGFCREMKDLQGYTRNVSKEIADYEARVRGKKADADKINAKLSLARQDLATYTVENNISELEDLDSELAELTNLIKEKTDDLKVCSKNCDELRIQISDHNTNHASSLKRRRELAKNHTSALAFYEKKKRSVEAYEEDLRSANKSWVTLEDDLISVRTSLFSLYKDLGSLEGGRAAITYTSAWDENLEKLRDLNPGYEFEKITTRDSVFITDIADLSHVPSATAVMAYKISACTNGEKGKCETATYPDSFSGTVVLSTVGACPVEHPDYFDLDLTQPNSAEEMNFGMTVAYDYPTAMTVKATAKYNMYKMYQKIVSSGKSGGFFKRKSWSSVTEKTFFRDSYNVNWDEQDREASIPEARKIELEQQMRNAIFDRLAKIGLPSVSNPGALVVPTVPASGAAVLGNELANNRACQANVYCTAASIGVKLLDAIFSSSSSSASYTNIQDVDMKDEWSQTSVVYRPYITSYIK
jgi:predicted  nucleic acid-binding Zn-ribbon protein